MKGDRGVDSKYASRGTRTARNDRRPKQVYRRFVSKKMAKMCKAGAYNGRGKSPGAREMPLMLRALGVAVDLNFFTEFSSRPSR